MNTELIVLHTTKFGENSLVVHTLSRDYGRRSFLVRGVGKKYMSLFLPLNILEAEVTESSRSTLFTARNLVSACPLLYGADSHEEVEGSLASFGVADASYSAVPCDECEVFELVAFVDEDVVDADESEVCDVIGFAVELCLQFLYFHF